MKHIVRVTRDVEVEVDESKFTPEFMAEFRESYYQFTTIEQHIEHIGQLYARNGVQWVSGADWIKGYGSVGDFGIRAVIVGQAVEIAS